MPESPAHDAAAATSPSALAGPLAQQPALRLIYDTAPIGLAFLSTDCRYLQINQRLTEICGISVEGHLGRTVRDCVPGLADAVEAIVRSIIDTGEPVLGIEVAGQRADQPVQRSWVTYWHPLRDPDGGIVGINVAAEEITERKRAEAALQASELETRRARDAAEAALQHLKDTQDSLIESEKLAALGRLVAGVAHEINSPVGTSLTVASSLGYQTAMFMAEAARGELRRSALNAFLALSRDASSQLVANLTGAAELISSFKQVAADRSYSDRREFDLADLTEQIAKSLRSGVGKLNPALRIECQPDLMMNSYPGPYGQVLNNLFLNSVAHAYPDGKQGTVEVRIQAVGTDHIEVLFCDDGCGMPPEVRKRAFDPFFTTGRDRGGTGLGLHIVHSIITNCLGGRLHLDSDVGKGTTVRLVLPRIAPAEPAAR